MKDDSDNELYHQEVMQLDRLLQQSYIGKHDSKGDSNVMVAFQWLVANLGCQTDRCPSRFALILSELADWEISSYENLQCLKCRLIN